MPVAEAAMRPKSGDATFRVRLVEQRLELGQFRRSEIVDLPIREAAQDQVHLAHAAMPRAKARPLAANRHLVVLIAGSGHGASRLIALRI
jgi:hypothetical protein